MSMVSTYALADDGKWYRNPVLGIRDRDFFICFDDDDPIELVIADHMKLEPEYVIERLGLDAKVRGKPHRAMRYFSGKFYDARAWWIDVHKPIPAEFITGHDGKIITIKPMQGVFYDFGVAGALDGFGTN